MSHQLSPKGARFWLAPLVLASSLYACGSSTSGGNDPFSAAGGAGPGIGASDGSVCSANADCASNVCADDVCVDNDNGTGAPSGSACKAGGDCASGSCTDKRCDADTSGGSAGTTGTSTGTGVTGSSCSAGDDCKSGLCVSGKCSAGTGPSPGAPVGTGTTAGPHFTGSGSGFRPLTRGCGPETATQCTGTCEQTGGDPNVTVIRPPVTLCFSGDGDKTPEDPSAVIEQVIEKLNGVSYVHIRVTFDPSFTDNTYGAGAQGWPAKRGHTFVGDLTKSDHTELLLTNGESDTVMNFKIDLVTADPTTECGFGSLGVTGGDGSVIVGDPKDVLAVVTSSERNLNGCGYCKSAACGPSGDCTVDSPPTDAKFTPNAATPSWDYRVVYETWIALDAFGSAGFGQAYITYTHSSPAKGTDTIMVASTPCPPEWDDPYCPPSVIAEGGNCFGTPTGGGGGTGVGGGTGAGGSGTGSGGSSTGGSGGAPGGGGGCPVNQQTYVTTEGASICTPIPFGGNPGMTPCPAGYHLDLATEGQFCLPN
jgi:hypothetical protein